MRKIIFIVSLIAVVLTTNYATRHKCRFNSCPYKGVTPNGWSEAVKCYVGEEGTDGYYIDLLHLQYPDLDADELNDLLFATKK